MLKPKVMSITAPLCSLLVFLAGAWLAASDAPAAAPPAPEESAGFEWRQLAEAAPGDAPTALASDGAQRLVVGGVRGVRELVPDQLPETLLRRGPVLDLAFLDDGRLLVATLQGLYRVDRDGQAHREALGSETVSRSVSRLAAARGFAVAATEAGVFLRGKDSVWQRVRALPRAAASLVALRSRGKALELWSVVAGELWISELRPEAEDPWGSATRVTLPVAGGSEAALDLGFDLPGAESVLVFPTTLAVRDASGVWRRLRPSLPPGARAQRLAQAFGRLWLATDRGLLVAPRIEGPWQRAGSPVGSLPVIGLQGGSVLVAATRRGVHVAAPLLIHGSAPIGIDDVGVVGDARARTRDEPSIGALHAAALRRQGLQVYAIRDLRQRVSRRGWLPMLQIGFSYEDERERNREHDQSFVSGDTRNLYDSELDRSRDLEVKLTLSWDLGDAVFHPDEIDVSREARSLIALRDDVLDEVTQLFFERLRVLARLEAAPPGSGERGLLALRATELAAGLDAWTGGAFSGAIR